MFFHCSIAFQMLKDNTKWPEMAPRWPQDGPKMAQDGPKMASRWPQDGPNIAPDNPKMAFKIIKNPREKSIFLLLDCILAPRSPKVAKDGPKVA